MKTLPKKLFPNRPFRANPKWLASWKGSLMSLCWIFLAQASLAQLDSRYTKFLVYQSQAIDYFPVWGDTDETLHINVMSKEWREIDLSKVDITVKNYASYEIGVNKSGDYTPVQDKELIRQLTSDTSWRMRQVRDAENHLITLDSDFSFTALSIDGEPIFEMDGNGHSLAISPSGRYVACLFELYGLVIVDIQQETKALAVQKKLMATWSHLEKANYYYEQQDLEGLIHTVGSFSEEEQTTIEYAFYQGMIMSLTVKDDSVQLQTALTYLLVACEDPRFHDAYIMISALYQERGAWEQSLTYAEKAIAALPDNGAGFYLKADYLKHIGKQTEAKTYYQQARNRGLE